MQLYLIRHAESENNARPVHQRVEDPAITAIGRLQAEHLARWANSMAIDCLISSPFLRTLQTTRAIVDQTDHTVHIWHNVFEKGGCYRGYGRDARDGGIGLGRHEIPRHVQASLAKCVIDETIDERGWWGGREKEQDHEAIERAKVVRKRLIDTFANRGETVLVVTHADFKRCLLSELLAERMDAHSLGPLRNTGVTKLNFDGNRWQLDWYNSVTHLPARLITGVE